MTPALTHQIGIMPTSLQTRPGATVVQIIAQFASYHHSQFTNSQLASYCKLYQLPPDALVTDLPLLQTRILALALALVHDPQLVLLDHPLAGLTPTAQTAFHRFVVRLRSEGRTILATFRDPLADNIRSVYDMVVKSDYGPPSEEG
jgi:ABC-2 type transport system ATP-binding protein